MGHIQFISVDKLLVITLLKTIKKNSNNNIDHLK